MNQHHHEHHPPNAESQAKLSNEKSAFALAISATFHCLIGCGVGEVVGVIIGTLFGWGMVSTMILGILLGFIFGFALGMMPVLKAGFTFVQAFRIVLISEGLSIAVMEAFEVLVQIYTPGVMEAGLTDVIFWYGMLAALVVGFVAAFPVNFIMLKKGIRHFH